MVLQENHFPRGSPGRFLPAPLLYLLPEAPGPLVPEAPLSAPLSPLQVSGPRKPVSF